MILAYAVAVAGKIEPPEGLRILNHGNLQCFYRERQEVPQPTEGEVREFFAANQALSAQADILEFRFPTVLHRLGELEEFLQRHEQPILSDLQRLQGLAQLTVYLPKRSKPTPDAAQSGTDYLRQRSARMQDEAAEIDAVRAVVGDALRDSSVQADRLLLLLPSRLAPRIAEELRAQMALTVAGPFPPSGFAKLLS